MGLKELMRNALMEGYASADLTMKTILTCILCTAVIAVYIFFVYKGVSKNSFYNRNFNLSLIALAVITAAIILTIQSNIVISLGMVGALSIVRFRTAIKDPMDLVFLFWSISAGIICGAGFALIAVIASIVLTVAIVVFSMLPASKNTLILVINALSHKNEAAIMEVVKENTQYFKIRARNVSKSNINLAVEVTANNQLALIDRLMELDFVTSASLVEHDGDVTV